MTLLLQELTKGVAEIKADERSIHWPFMSSPFPILFVSGLYLAAVKWGPRFMEKRAPYDIDRIVQLYNLIQIATCTYLALFAMYSFGPSGSHQLFCGPLDLERKDERLLDSLKMGYIYFLLKLVDLFDTVFFVLRKKNSQITVLHVHHHAMMVVLTWISLRYFAGGSSGFIAMINCIVHAIMYSYYFLTNWKKEYKKNIWWKKHITQLQLFLIFFVYGLLHLYLDGCGLPKWAILAVGFPQLFIVSYLFVDFYRKSYAEASRKNK